MDILAPILLGLGIGCIVTLVFVGLCVGFNWLEQKEHGRRLAELERVIAFQLGRQGLV